LAAPTERVVDISGLTFGYVDAEPLFCDASLCVEGPAIAAIVGRSGSGKTTLLRLLCDLLPFSQGTLRVLGRSPADARRQGLIGLVQQRAVLLRWRTVAENIRLPGELAGHQPAAGRVDELAAAVGLAGASHLMPAQLSAGMASRVAIARALLLPPRILFLDEPFAHLDDLTRRDLEDLVHAIHVQYRLSALIVTHNLEEAVFLADSIHVVDPRARRLRQVEIPAPATTRDGSYRHSATFRAAMAAVEGVLRAVG
jgi:NitT/TauT family transport system ATP-binding protein